MVVIGFTGTRGRLSAAQAAALTQRVATLRAAGAKWMHNGDCVGADLAAAQAWYASGGRLHLHPAEVDAAHRAFFPHAEVVEAPLPPLVRNRVIVNNATHMVACPRGQEVARSGTWATIRYARRLRRPILIIWPEGRTQSMDWNL